MNNEQENLPQFIRGMARSAPLLAFASPRVSCEAGRRARKQGGGCSIPYQLINQFTN